VTTGGGTTMTGAVGAGLGVDVSVGVGDGVAVGVAVTDGVGDGVEELLSVGLPAPAATPSKDGLASPVCPPN
jgi:hypothetical protein